MNRNTLVGLIALAVVALGAFLYYGFWPAPAKAPGGSVTTSLTNPYTEHGAYYDVSAAYPTSTPLPTKASEVVVDVMQGWMLATISQFKSDTNAENPSAEDSSVMGFDQGRKVSLDIKYQTFTAPHTVSYVFTTYEDTGGAHGNTFLTTFTFDTPTGTELALADLFTASSGYLGKLSSIARAKLPGILGEMADTQMIEGGTAPEAKSFESWYLDGSSLVLLFPPYAVAAYAAGTQTLTIPLSNLADILKLEYR